MNIYPLFHTDAHEPEREAAAKMHRSGKAKLHREIVMDFLMSYNGSTAPEVGKMTGLGHVEAQRRLSDLANAGMIEKSDRRECTVLGKSISTWKILP